MPAIKIAMLTSLGRQFCSFKIRMPNRNAMMIEVRRSGEMTEIKASG